MTNKLKRAAFYVDGFNLYHAIDALCMDYAGNRTVPLNHLKWLSLHDLANKLIPKADEEVVSVTYFSAFPKEPNKAVSLIRHRAYRDALIATGVECVMGRYTDRPCRCKKCRQDFIAQEEKETDVNIGIRIIADAYKGRYDVCYLISADTDFTPAIQMLVSDFPKKRFVTVSPPSRGHPQKFLELAERKLKITQQTIEMCLLPERVGTVVRPPAYDPPTP